MQSLIGRHRLLYLERILTACYVVAFLSILIIAATKAFTLPARILFFSALFFLLISLLRRFIGAKRPYQETEVAPPRNGKDDSFPSRHAYSAFYIATLSFYIAPAFSYSLFPGAILLSLLRVARGVHFPRDVVAGAFIGVLAAILVLIAL